MLKRTIAILVVCLFLMPSFTAYADVIVEPENDFYARYKSHIIYLGRSFTANGEGGSVSVKKEPGARGDMAILPNGSATYIQYSCLYDGDFWGFTFEHSGWIKLDQMFVLYDYVAFAEDHLDELYLYTGDYAEIKKDAAAVVWPWPGAESSLWTFEDLDTDNFRVSLAYKDKDGREWGFVTYLYGNRNIWICLSDPLNRDLPALIPEPEPTVWVSETAHVDIKQYSPEKERPILAVIIVLVTVLVIGTAVLIKIFWKPNKTKPEGRSND